MLDAPSGLKNFSAETALRGLPGILVAALALSCTGEIGGSGGPAPPPDVEPKQVPQSLEVIVGQGFCIDMASGEKLVSVSPEGHAWLVAEQSQTSTLRVLDAFDQSNVLSDEIELTQIRRVQAWSQTDAAIITEDGLWRLEDLARVQLSPPQGFTSTAGFCGDPGTNGSLLCSGKLYERREDDQWWAWTPGAGG